MVTCTAARTVTGAAVSSGPLGMFGALAALSQRIAVPGDLDLIVGYQCGKYPRRRATRRDDREKLVAHQRGEADRGRCPICGWWGRNRWTCLPPRPTRGGLPQTARPRCTRRGGCAHLVPRGSLLPLGPRAAELRDLLDGRYPGPALSHPRLLWFRAHRSWVCAVATHTGRGWCSAVRARRPAPSRRGAGLLAESRAGSPRVPSGAAVTSTAVSLRYLA